MLTLIYNVCAESANYAQQIGGWVTLAIDIIASLLFLYKAIKTKGMTFGEALKNIFTIFSRASRRAKELTDKEEGDEGAVQQENTDNTD